MVIVLAVALKLGMFAGTGFYCLNKHAYIYALLMLFCITSNVAYLFHNQIPYVICSNVATVLMCFLIIRRIKRTIREEL